MSKNFSKKSKEYYIGLDIGTDSVGWAVTDRDYKLLRVNAKNLWGVRLFETAQTAAARRLFRETRRRLSRRKFRIELLQEIFAPAINAVDPDFFARLADSNLYEEDKRENTKFSLFRDENFNDRDFHKKYKTVYHLRYAMMHEDDPDVRLVYLALHHIIKNRGHFLIEGGLEAVKDMSQPLTAINAYLQDLDCGQLPMRQAEFDEISNLKCNKTVRAKKYAECFGVEGNKQLCALLRLVAGGTVKVKDLPCHDKTDVDESITFDTDWNAAEINARELLQEDYVLVENAKLLYDYVRFKQLLGEYSFVSEAMIAKYEKHRSDLAALKEVVRKYCDDDVYDEIFKQPKNGECNYTAYCGKRKFGKNGERFEYKKKCTNEDFCKFIYKILKPLSQNVDDETLNAILADIDNGTFMPKQVGKNNATLPYQVNEKELTAILDHVKQYPTFAFLNETENGVTVAEKIRQLLVFRVPYFVGPTNNHSGRYWAVRREEGKLFPWNFAQKIDYDESERRFIERMTNFCPYVPGEKVLPKCSLLYEEYVFLNTVSSVKINNEPLSAKNKAELSKYFAMTGASKLTGRFLRQWLTENNLIEQSDDVLLTGFDEGASAHRRMYYQFVKILGSDSEVEKHYRDIEKIIFDCTIAGTEKSRLRKRLASEYPFLSEAQIKSIVGLTCKGWGRCSAEFLTKRVGVDPFTGETNSISVIDAMRKTTDNFMQVYNKYGFREYFERRQDDLPSIEEAIDNLYCSPSVKKQIRQTMSIVEELRGVLGRDPAKIFVEVARDRDAAKERRQERERAKSRLQSLREKLYGESRSAVAEQFAESPDVRKHFEEVSDDPRRLNNTKLFLYFLQNGVDIYTGEPIDYNNLSLYDKDHIYPRSKVKDDSLDNLVLTYHTQNVKKTDDFPIAKEIRDKMRPRWETLRRQKLMSDEKYRRLTRKTPISDEEINDFINRQLVETQQSTKETIKLLRTVFPDSEVVYSKASLVSEFRARRINVPDPNALTESDVIRVPQFVKCREINDLHHAKDAYLNIVVGNVYNTRYGHNRDFMTNGVDRGPSDANIYDYDVYTSAYTAWKSGASGTIAQVTKTMRSNSVLYTAESRVKSGGLFDATIYPKSDQPLVPQKGANSATAKFRNMSDTSKYGGYNSESRVYFTLVRFVDDKARKKGVEKYKYRLLGVTARFASVINSLDALTEYCRNCGLTDPVVLIPKIKIGTFFQFGSTMLALSGMTGKQIVWRLAQQNVQDEETVRYFKKVCDVVDKQAAAEKRGEEFVLNSFDGVDEKRNAITYDIFAETLLSDRYGGAASLTSFGEKINSPTLRERFAKLTLSEQCRVLVEISKVLQCNSLAANLTLLKEGAKCGIVLSSNTFDSLSGIRIVHRSVTGLFEQKIPLSEFDKASPQ